MQKLFICLLVFLVTKTYAQDEEKFLKNKLYVITIGYPQFDSALKNTILREWKASEIAGFISKKELKNFQKSKENSFLEPGTCGWSGNPSGSRSNNGIFMYIGNRKGISLYSDPIKSIFTGGNAMSNFEKEIDLVELYIRILNNEFVYYKSMDSLNSIYNLSLLKKKKILLIDSLDYNMGYYNKEAFEEYPYKFSYTNRKEISKLVKEKDKRYVFAYTSFGDMPAPTYLYDLETCFKIGELKNKGGLGSKIRKKDVKRFVSNIEESE